MLASELSCWGLSATTTQRMVRTVTPHERLPSPATVYAELYLSVSPVCSLLSVIAAVEAQKTVAYARMAMANDNMSQESVPASDQLLPSPSALHTDLCDAELCHAGNGVVACVLAAMQTGHPSLAIPHVELSPNKPQCCAHLVPQPARRNIARPLPHG